MKKYILFSLVFFLLRVYPCGAQKIPRDAWQWSTFSLDKKLSEKFYFGFEEELRLFDNMSRINLFFSNVGFSYRYNRHFRISLVYRFIEKSRVDQAYSKRHRLYVDVSYRKKYYAFNFIYRVRFQSQVRDYYSSALGKYRESYMRHKFDLQYTYKKFTPYAAAEFRFQFTNPRFNDGDNLWNRERFYLGTDYAISKHQSFGLYYMIQRDLNNQNQERDFVIGIEYGLSF